MSASTRAPRKVRQPTAFHSMQSVMDAAVKKLDTSVLTPDDAKELRLEVYSADEALKLSGLPAFFAGIMIPYFDFKGRASKFWRYRYLEETKVGWDALTDKKPLRYAQPKNSLSEIYLPPLNGTNWAVIAKDPTQAIIITEGEFKAASATKHGYPTIGLGGVWSFKSNAQRQNLLPQLKEITWTGRTVFIAYDSDAVTNPQVMTAENALARELMLLGADPQIIRLKPIKGLKAGLDDVILHQGPDKIGDYMDKAVEWKAAQELFQLNQEVVYVRDPGVILQLDDLRRIAPRAFVDHAYSTRIYYEQQVSEKGTKLVERSAAKEWLKWPSRAEVDRVTYAPGEPRITGKNELNVWSGWGLEPKLNAEVLKHWHDLLNFIFHGDKDAIKWFTQWCAYPLQNPGTKMYSCVVLHGRAHGSGKSLVGYTLGTIYGRNFTEIKEKDLHGGHNEWAQNKQLVMGEEITAGDKRQVADFLKGMITQRELRINQKYIPAYTVPDCINYLFTSNHPDSFFLEDDDRRYFIWEVEGSPMERAFYRAYDKVLKSGELGSALFHYLKRIDLTGFDALGPAPMTTAKQEMIEGGRSDVANWCARLRDDVDGVLRVGDAVVRFDLFRADDLLALYDPEEKKKLTVNGMARELKKAGFKRPCGTTGCRTSKGQIRIWAIRNPDKYTRMTADELGAQYDKERGKDVEARRPEGKRARKAKF